MPSPKSLQVVPKFLASKLQILISIRVGFESSHMTRVPHLCGPHEAEATRVYLKLISIIKQTEMKATFQSLWNQYMTSKNTVNTGTLLQLFADESVASSDSKLGSKQA